MVRAPTFNMVGSWMVPTFNLYGKPATSDGHMHVSVWGSEIYRNFSRVCEGGGRGRATHPLGPPRVVITMATL